MLYFIVLCLLAKMGNFEMGKLKKKKLNKKELKNVPKKTRLQDYISLVRSTLEYGESSGIHSLKTK